MAGLLLLALAPVAHADTVTLKTGRKIEGIIDPSSTTPDRVVIRTPTGVVNVPRANVADIKQDKDISYGEASGDLAALGGDLDRARTLYESALEADPGNEGLVAKLRALQEKIDLRDKQKYGPALDQISQALAAADYQQAIKLSRSLMERAPEDSIDRRCSQRIVDAYLGIARQHRQAKAWENAKTAYLSAFETDPDNPLPPLELAEMLSDVPEEKLSAIAYFNQALDLAAKHPGRIDEDRLLNAQFMLGKDYFDLKNYRLATVTLLNVMRKDTQFRHPGAIDLAVEAYGLIGAGSSPADQQEIVNNLQAYILIYQKNERAILLLGRVYFDMGDWADSIKTHTMLTGDPQADAANPLIQEALYYEGLAQRRMNNFPAAAQSLERIVDHGGGNYNVFVELGELRLLETRYKEAYDLFVKALAADPSQSRGWFDMGRVLTETGLNDEALTNLKKAAELSPRDPEIRYQIARNYLAKGNYDEAIKLGRGIIGFVRKNAADPPTSDQARLLADCFMILGDANGRLGRHAVARQRYAKVIEYQPGSGRGHEAIGLSYQSDGIYKEAQDAFERALNLGIHWQQFVKNPRKALPYYQKYIELGGKDPRVAAWIDECGGKPSS